MNGLRSRFSRELRLAGAIALLVPAVLQLVRLASVLRARAPFPMDLEWMEGGHLYHAYRLTHGLPLYGGPARGFATFPYPPVYWAVLGGAGALFGLDYPTARLLSVACIAGTAAILLGAIVRRAPNRAVGAVFAVLALAGIATAYPLTGGSFDLARNDALALFFPVLAAALVGERTLAPARAVAVAAVLSLAIYTKQTGIFFAFWLIAFVFRRDRRGGITLAAATFGFCAAGLATLWLATNGWFFVWLFDQSHHGLRTAEDWSSAIGIFLVHAPFLLGLAWLIPHLEARGALSPSTVKWGGMLGAAFFASIVPFMKVWGWLNVLTPFLVLSWPVALLFANDWLRDAAPPARERIVAGALVIGAALTASLTYDRARFAPSEERQVASDKLRALVRDLDGEVVVTTSPFIAVREKKGVEQPILQGYADAERGGLAIDYAAALDRSRAKWLIVSPTAEFDYRDALGAKFEFVRPIDFPVQFMGGQPVSLWRRR
jgi:hypothetical protein